MNTIPLDGLESRISDVVALTTELAKAHQKNRLRKALAELADLKAQRSMSTIHQLDFENGLEDLV